MTLTIRRLALAASAAVLLIAASRPALAGAFYIQEQSVKGLGRAYSGEASDVGPASLWWNPAAIAGTQGIEIASGIQGVLSTSTLRDTGSTITRPGGQPTTGVGGVPRDFNPLLPGAVPDGDIAWRINEHLAVGLAISAPFDFITKYDNASFTRYQALTSRLFDLDLQPTVAYRVNRFIDLGVGFDAQYTDATLSSALPNLSPLLPDGYNRLSGDGWDYGWTAGAQVHPTDRISVGASYRSRIDHTLNGTVQVSGLLGPLAGSNASGPGTAKFRTPWIATLGGHYVLSDQLTLEAQTQRVGWSEFRSIDVQTGAGLQASAQGYHDTESGSVGLDYAVNPRWTLRSGVEYDPTPTPNRGRSARVPDSDRWLYSVGTSVAPTPKLTLDAALGYIDFKGSSLDSDATAFAGTPVQTPINYAGTVRGSAVIVSAGARVRF